MPGRPKLRAMLATIADAGGVDYVIQRVADGENLMGIAAELDISRNMLSDWLNSDPGRKAALQQARAVAASVLAEQALIIADTATDVNRARLQVDTRRWLAGKYSPQEFGEAKHAAVEINIGQLHLEALREYSKQGRYLNVTPDKSTT